MTARTGPGLAVVVGAVALGVADISTVNSILPELRRDLGATASDLQWVVSGYLLAYGLAMVVTGRIGDTRGRRPTFLAGITIFTAASLVAALAPEPRVLIVARVVQGFGGGFLNPQATALIRDLVAPARRARLFAVYTAVVGAAVATGPFLGGVLGAAGWRWVFWVNVPLGLVSLVGGALWLPRPAIATTRPPRPDVVGVGLLWVGLVLLLVPFFEMSELPGRVVAASLVAAAVVLAAFAAWESRLERHGGAPVVDLALFRSRSYTCGVALNLSYQAAVTALLYVLTLYLRSGLGLHPVAAGAMLLPLAVGSLAAAPVASRVASRPRHVELVGVALMVGGTAVTWAAVEVFHDSTAVILWAIVVPLAVLGVGIALVMSMNLGVTNAEIPAAEAGSANAVRQTSSRIGSTLGTATVGALFLAALGPAGVGTTARGDWDRALSSGMALVLVFFALTIVPVAVDLVGYTREKRAARP
ncbi:MAG: MFS transporter [Cellulomonas sp.]|uniref:MFS transporter n=1 Tax=Cellulomonas sp. TaxID=40001 RepID=UPI001A0E03EC|nr:MFS transporter [Cellulomonas sp.]MBF0688016.1 MFS transporter [Cellulomonas sp.]